MEQEINNTPTWIRRHQEQKAAETNQVQEDQQRQMKASALITEKGLEFWREFVKQIGVNVKALKDLEGEELVGSVSLNESGREHHCHIEINRQSVRFGPALSQMNLWYLPGGNYIRHYYQHQNAGDIELASNHNDVCALTRNGPMSARKLADSTAQAMAENVKVKRGSPGYV